MLFKVEKFLCFTFTLSFFMRLESNRKQFDTRLPRHFCKYGFYHISPPPLCFWYVIEVIFIYEVEQWWHMFQQISSLGLERLGAFVPFQTRTIPCVDNWIRTTPAIVYHVRHWITYLSFAATADDVNEWAQLDPSLYSNTPNEGSLPLLLQGAYN